MFTIDDAIDNCRDRARMAEVHGMPHSKTEWERITNWLELLRDAPAIIEAAKLGYARIYDSDTVQDVRERQIEKTRGQVEKILEGLSA